MWFVNLSQMSWTGISSFLSCMIKSRWVMQNAMLQEGLKLSEGSSNITYMHTNLYISKTLWVHQKRKIPFYDPRSLNQIHNIWTSGQIGRELEGYFKSWTNA